MSVQEIHLSDIADAALKLFPPLATLPPERQQQLWKECLPARWKAGHMIMKKGQECPFVALVLSGVMRVYKLGDNGREMTLYRAGKGETCLISIACRLTGEDFPASAIVEEDAFLLLLPPQVYEQVLDPHLDWKDFLLTSLYRRLSQALTALEAVAFERVDKRLAQQLLAISGGKRSTIYMTHEKLGVELGTAREVVSRTLKELEHTGAVALSRGRIRVIEPELLRQMTR